MSLLNSKFDITSVESPLAVAALAQVLDVAIPGGAQLYSGTGDAFQGGTPLTPDAIAYPPGTVVMMDANGKAVRCDCPVLFTAVPDAGSVAAGVDPVMPFVTIDGNTDYSGRFVRKLTVFQGGFTMQTDQYDVGTGAFAPGKPVTVVGGRIVPRQGANAGRQIYGWVGPKGLDAVNGTLEVIVPQGAGY